MLDGCSPASPPSVRAHGLRADQADPGALRVVVDLPSVPKNTSMSSSVKKSGAPVRAVEDARFPSRCHMLGHGRSGSSARCAPRET